MLKPGSLDIYKNATVLIIVMLGHSKVNTKVSDIDVETTESDDCKELLVNDKDANGMLVIIWERVRFSCKDR